MRKLNIFVVIGILICFITHAIMGSMKLVGAYAGAPVLFARMGEGLVYVHIIIVCKLTYDTLKARKLSGAGYFKGNEMFWLRRISGLFILIPLVMHFMVFGTAGAEIDAHSLQAFTTGRLISQIMLVAAIALHLLINLRPMMISLGTREYKAFKVDALLVLSALLLMFGIAFVIYYIRWMNF